MLGSSDGINMVAINWVFISAACVLIVQLLELFLPTKIKNNIGDRADTFAILLEDWQGLTRIRLFIDREKTHKYFVYIFSFLYVVMAIVPAVIDGNASGLMFNYKLSMFSGGVVGAWLAWRYGFRLTHVLFSRTQLLELLTYLLGMAFLAVLLVVVLNIVWWGAKETASFFDAEIFFLVFGERVVAPFVSAAILVIFSACIVFPLHALLLLVPTISAANIIYKLMSFLTWRIVDYNNGAFSAIVLVITIVSGGVALAGLDFFA